ncbi:MAG TPA: ribosome maturation factor RimP [Bacilli bacterium]
MGKQIKSIVEEMLQPLLVKGGFELVDIEYVKEGNHWFLRIFADKEGGIDIDDCSKISEYISEKLDEEDPIPEAFFLEVSSPGAERPLKKTEDYTKAVNKQVLVTTYEPIEGMKEFEGKLISYDSRFLTIQVSNKQHALPTDKIASARLAVVF